MQNKWCSSEFDQHFKDCEKLEKYLAYELKTKLAEKLWNIVEMAMDVNDHDTALMACRELNSLLAKYRS